MKNFSMSQVDLPVDVFADVSYLKTESSIASTQRKCGYHRKNSNQE